MSGSEEEEEEYTDENGEKQVRKVKKKCKYNFLKLEYGHIFIK